MARNVETIPSSHALEGGTLKNRVVRSVGTVIVAGVVMFGAVLPASATTEYPAGGIWDHGYRRGNPDYVYSNYWNNNVTWHRSSVRNANGVYVNSGWKDKSVWANASVWAVVGQSDSAYYDYIK
ncbi:lactococcin 972 family bacteriocin [Demequina capsici]|uniref:Lactococcin 972 family bacteriocin n=1 Tax=Demequina capsici TaxID=3075620 RepID=A0AA96F9P1_9MICO|nr:lactococcin 972 family bacteriocin [Demequina sp. OYTSA14]WNM24200.1 lactococcin 972 family bacteriocin [Demequina sp. OYTSA14]